MRPPSSRSRRRLARLALLLATLVAGALTTGAAPASAACTSASKASFAKVQLWADPGCGGGSVIVPKTGDDDRPDFTIFKNYDGKIYNVHNTRSSVSLASGWCVKFFDHGSYSSVESPLYCAQTAATAHYNLTAFDNKASSMRTCPNSIRTQCNKTPTTPAPAPTRPPGSTTPAPAPATPPATEEDPVVTDDPEVADPEAEYDVDPGTDPLAEELPPEDDPALSDDPSGGSDLGPLGPNDGLAFDKAGRRCSGGTTKGAFALRIWLTETALPQRGQARTYRCNKKAQRRKKRQSLLGVGRAVDFKPATKDVGRELVAMLLADDYSLIRRMGIQEIIYDGMVWSSAQPTPILRRYRGSTPYRRDVHIGLNRAGAAKKTSFWVGR